MAPYDPTQNPKQPPLRGIIGTDDDDTLYGTRENDVIHGLKGSDKIYGYGGDDWLYGEESTHNPYNGGNKLYGGEGNDHLIGGDGIDYLDGEEDNDYLAGGKDSDLLRGGAGNDYLSGQDGDDKLTGGEGADKLNGGAGVDAVMYTGSPSAVTVNLDTGMGSGGDATGDLYYGIEYAYGSDFDDTLIGSADSNAFWGGAGKDTLFGLGGDDILLGEEGADYLNGGDGTDTASYITCWAAVTVNLATGTASGGDAEGDTFSSIENLSGSWAGDCLIGDDETNELKGGNGGDALFGGGGADILRGGRDQDMLTGGDGPDTFAFAKSDSVGPDYDYIMDFKQADSDKIDLTKLAGGSGPPSLDFIGGAAFSGIAGQIRFEQANGETLVSADIDGDGQADFAIYCVGTINFNANDFLL